MKNLLLIAITVLAVGCGGKDESTTETKPVEEKVVEVKEEVKTEEPVVETKPKPEGVNAEELEERESIRYFTDSETPYTGKVYGLYENGQKQFEGKMKDGKKDGLWIGWYEKGKKQFEVNWKDDKLDGPALQWYENGQKQIEANNMDGNVIGLHVAWHENGQKETTRTAKGMGYRWSGIKRDRRWVKETGRMAKRMD